MATHSGADRIGLLMMSDYPFRESFRQPTPLALVGVGLELDLFLLQLQGIEFFKSG